MAWGWVGASYGCDRYIASFTTFMCVRVCVFVFVCEIGSWPEGPKRQRSFSSASELCELCFGVALWDIDLCDFTLLVVVCSHCAGPTELQPLDNSTDCTRWSRCSIKWRRLVGYGRATVNTAGNGGLPYWPTITNNQFHLEEFQWCMSNLSRGSSFM